MGWARKKTGRRAEAERRCTVLAMRLAADAGEQPFGFGEKGARVFGGGNRLVRDARHCCRLRGRGSMPMCRVGGGRSKRRGEIGAAHMQPAREKRGPGQSGRARTKVGLGWVRKQRRRASRCLRAAGRRAAPLGCLLALVAAAASGVVCEQAGG